MYDWKVVNKDLQLAEDVYSQFVRDGMARSDVDDFFQLLLTMNVIKDGTRLDKYFRSLPGDGRLNTAWESSKKLSDHKQFVRAMSRLRLHAS